MQAKPLFLILGLLMAPAALRAQADPATQAANTWILQYHKAALGDVTHPYENGFSWDYKNNIGVVYGGHLGTYTGQSDNVLPDIMNTNMTYLFSFGDYKFSKAFPMDRPVKRCGVKLCYDDNLGLTLAFAGAHHGFFNGYLEPNLRLSGLAEEGRRSTTVPYQLPGWAFDGASRQWYPLRPLIMYSPTNTTPYYGFNINYAFAREFGLAVMMPTQYNRVYAYSAYSNQWALLPSNTADPAFPPVETYPCVTYDLKHRRFITYFANSASNETWSFDVGTHSWTKLTLSGSAPASAGGWNQPYGCTAYDSRNGVHVYLRGDGGQTWALNLDSMKWSSRAPSTSPASGGSLGEGLTYDPVRNASIVYSAETDEVWTYKYGPGITGRPEPPNAPQGITGDSRIDITWSAPVSGPSPAGYYLYRCEWEDNKLTSSSLIPGPYVKVDSTTSTAWSDTNTAVIKKAGAFHSYFISAYTNSGMESDPLAPVYTRLRVPLALTATVYSKNRVVLRWKPKQETDLAGYNVYRAQNAYPRQIAMKSTKLNSALITGTPVFEDNTMKIATDTLALYVVTAVNRLGKESGLSPFATTAPDWPLNLWADTLLKTITWSPPRNGEITGYRIYESPVDTFDEIMDGYENLLAPIATTTDTFWNYAARTPGGAYKVRAINALGQEGHFSDVFEIRTKDMDTIGVFRLDYMTEKPVRDAFYDDLPPLVSIETAPRARNLIPGALRVIPNPFHPSAAVHFALAAAGPVSVKAFDVSGREVKRIFKGPLSAGAHSVKFSALEWPAGVYFVELVCGRTRLVNKVMLSR